MIHTIIETMRYLATDFLGATQPNSVKIFTTGHSLGGAMCTNFAY
jgi:poly(3-hydroxybutyrate) depolymerase